jgi:predicted phage terminase large subunit-like protein
MVFGKVPDCEFIHISYSATLAANNAFQTRNLVQETAFKRVFPEFKLRDDSKAKDDWRTVAGGVCYAQGTGGTITGFGAGKIRKEFGGAIIIDDPHKASEASSDTIRGNVIEWFQNTLESRTNSPDTPIIVIMQRLHEQDLAGWLLDGGNGEEWEHLCLPAIQPDGSALWPEKHSERLRVMEMQRRMSSLVSTDNYHHHLQVVFKPDRIEIVDALPAEFIKEVRAWDLAASENEGDWTAGPRMLKTKENMIYIVDMVRGRWGPDGVENTIKQTAQMDGKSVSIRLPQDPGQAGKSQAKNFITMLSGFNVKAETVSGDKITRAQPFAAQVNIGNVKMLRGDWNKALIEELRNFPNGTHDDQVDGCSDGFTELNEARIGKKPAGAGSRTYQ